MQLNQLCKGSHLLCVYLGEGYAGASLPMNPTWLSPSGWCCMELPFCCMEHAKHYYFCEVSIMDHDCKLSFAILYKAVTVLTPAWGNCDSSSGVSPFSAAFCSAQAKSLHLCCCLISDVGLWVSARSWFWLFKS